MAKSPETTNDHDQARTETTKKTSSFEPNRNWFLAAIAVLIVMLAFVGGMGLANNRNLMHHTTNGGPIFKRGMMNEGGGMGGRRFMTGGGYGNSVSVNGQTRTKGVVTAVNGSDFTIAGNGSTTDVVTNSSTQYRNGNQVKPNDSVVVFGTTSDNKLTATQIIINP